jgi:hypothetical protein
MFLYISAAAAAAVLLGTYQDVGYKLMTFGIPMGIFPIGANEDELLLENHREWVSQRRILEARLLLLLEEEEKEAAAAAEERILVPGLLDVLMGKKKEIKKHSGNLRYQNIIADRADTYDQARRTQKTAIAEDVLRTIKESGGRFLRADEAGWLVVEDAVSREKISNAFRDRRKQQLLVSERTKLKVQREADAALLLAAMSAGPGGVDVSSTSKRSNYVFDEMDRGSRPSWWSSF